MNDFTIDPATGQPATPAATAGATTTQPPKVEIPAEEWGAMKARLDIFEKGAYNNQPQAPPAPSGPTITDQINEIEGEIAKIDAQIDKNVENGHAVSELIRKRSTLDRKITRLQIKSEDIDPVISAGMQSIDQITNEVSRGKMQYYDLVKDDYEKLLNGFPVDQRSSLELKQRLYQLAVGQNMDRILDAKKEELLRAGHDNTQTPPPNGSSRSQSGDDKTPKPADILSRDALSAIKSRGLTVDEYYRRRGHDGWKGYFEKHKEYYIEKGLIDA